MACSSCKALAEATGTDTGMPSWWPLAAVGVLAAVGGVLWLSRDRCPDAYDDYVVGVRTKDDRLRAHAVREARQMKCSWATKVRR